MSFLGNTSGINRSGEVFPLNWNIREILLRHFCGMKIFLKITFFTVKQIHIIQAVIFWGENKEFYIYYYIVQNGETSLIWKINDFVKDCEFDLKLISLTKPDSDGSGWRRVNEIWTMYRFGCKRRKSLPLNW